MKTFEQMAYQMQSEELRAEEVLKQSQYKLQMLDDLRSILEEKHLLHQMRVLRSLDGLEDMSITVAKYVTEMIVMASQLIVGDEADKADKTRLDNQMKFHEGLRPGYPNCSQCGNHWTNHNNDNCSMRYSVMHNRWEPKLDLNAWRQPNAYRDMSNLNPNKKTDPGYEPDPNVHEK